ncbi:cell wall-binding repeat-containing protein [Bacillus sp. Y1]|nr:cell wall-binding repeat-containing protein [Bacillus sp. Y1]
MKKIVLLLLALVIMVFNPIFTSAAGTAERLAGADRFEVAVNVSNKGWVNGASTVVLVNYNAYADALSAAPLAYKLDGPILLTHPTQLTEVTKNEILRLRPSQVIIAGGTGSVSDTVIQQVRSLGISNVRRIDGVNRYEVALNVSKELPPSSSVVMAYGLNFPDALAIAPYAARNGYPILLTATNDLPAKTREALAFRNPQSTIIVGGEGSISNNVQSQLPSPMRIGGKDRYEVATNIIRTLNLNTSKVQLATGLTFADALTGSVLAAKEDTPLLLTAPTALPETTRALIVEKNISNFLILGGLGSVSQKVASQVSGPLGGLKIVVDAGHGGVDPGAIGNGLSEEDVVLDVAKRVKPKLESLGAIVVMTRESDVYPSLSQRVDLANSQNANAFISVHANSSTSSSANGTETYWNSLYFGEESKALASSIQQQLVNNMGTYNRGVKEGPFYVIKNTTMPSVLVELAFISNSSDAKKLGDPAYRERAAEAIYQGVVNYYQVR